MFIVMSEGAAGPDLLRVSFIGLLGYKLIFEKLG